MNTNTNENPVNFDEHAITDLLLFAENSRAVYIGTTWLEHVPGAVITGPGLEWMTNCIVKHIRRGNGSIERAENGIFSVLTFAAKVYNRLFSSSDCNRIFPAALRREAARRYVAAHYSDWEWLASQED